jgi:hypothetical protein
MKKPPGKATGVLNKTEKKRSAFFGVGTAPASSSHLLACKQGTTTCLVAGFA